MPELPQIDPVTAAITKLSEYLDRVGSETTAVDAVAGRILAEPLLSDRPSPAMDVSAMDGYAMRLADVAAGQLPVCGTIAAGSPPFPLPVGQAAKIFTGAPVPTEADVVVKREDTTEQDDQVVLKVTSDDLKHGQHIRRAGENISAGAVVLTEGTELTAVAIAATSFSQPHLTVRRPVRVSILNTGDEIVQPGEPVLDWQIRDSNGPTLQAWLDGLSWCDVVQRRRVQDTLPAVEKAIQEALGVSDAVILTGGVSMGDADYVPEAIRSVGGEIVFHRLPIRPGKPVLGAACNGKLILGLPGNPVSVAVTSRVFGLPLLRKLAGAKPQSLPHPLVSLDAADDRGLDLTWFRLVEIDDMGAVRLAATKGSGDLVSLARSDGFVELPPGETGRGPWRLYSW